MARKKEIGVLGIAPVMMRGKNREIFAEILKRAAGRGGRGNRVFGNRRQTLCPGRNTIRLYRSSIYARDKQRLE
jgi:hypothetical protein